MAFAKPRAEEWDYHRSSSVLDSPSFLALNQRAPTQLDMSASSERGNLSKSKSKTFLFTLYGTIPGKVLSVSDDAVPIEKVGLVYPTRVSIDRSTIQIDGKQVNLSPGMAVTVEIKTGKRRLIEYLLSPLLKSVKESLRER